MIQKVVEHINSRLVAVKGFDPVRIRGLCEYIQEPDRKYPGIYSGNDTVDFITSNDFKNGVIWHMKNGDFSFNDLGKLGRHIMLEYSQPMKLYAIIRRGLYSDTAYSADELALNIFHLVNQKTVRTLLPVMDVSKVQIKANSFSVDKDELDSVFQGVDIENLKRYDLMYCSLSYDIILTGSQECFVNYGC